MKKAKLHRRHKLNSVLSSARSLIPPNRTCGFHRIRLFAPKEISLGTCFWPDFVKIEKSLLKILSKAFPEPIFCRNFSFPLFIPIINK
jgi:hypothetical protein